MITLPLDLTVDGQAVRVTRIGADAVVYHRLAFDDATPADLIRDSDDLPAPGFVLTDDTTAEDIAAHIANPPPPPPAPPRELSKLTLRRRLRALGKEVAFDATLDAVPNARADWDDAQVLRTDDPLFTTHAAAFKAALGLTDEEFTALLAP